MPRLLAFLAFVPVVLAGLLCAPAVPAGAQTVVTDLSDPVGDDYGPGTYVYPTNEVFTDGVFDLTRFRVLDQGPSVRFEFTLAAEVTNPWSSSDGFSVQSIDLFIDTDGVPGSGNTMTIDGRWATVASRDAWDLYLWVAPTFEGFQTVVIFADGDFEVSGIDVSVDGPAGIIAVDVAKSLVGTPQSGWKYIVAMLSQDGYDIGRVRRVNAQASEWGLGGGEDEFYDSNIIDLITSGGISQEAMLSRYDSALEISPVLYASDNLTPPEIVHAPVTTGEAHRPLSLTATVTDDVVAGVWARHAANGAAYETVPLDRGEGDVFSGSIPGRAVSEGTLHYFLVASDGFDSTTAPADTTAPYAVAVGPDVTPPTPTGVSVKPDRFAPGSTSLREAVLSVTFPEPVQATVEIVDSTGAPVKTLVDGVSYDEGAWTFPWDGTTAAGDTAAAGRYRFRVDAEDLALRSAGAEADVVVDPAATRRQLEVVLLFHFNQSLVPAAKVADLACYHGLLEELRRHPDSRFSIHISGCLLHSLLWFNPSTVELARAGARDGQFEIVGSTYIQNIMYSTRSAPDDFQQNEAQIRYHRELLEKTFGVVPVTFWNCERVWTQNFAELLDRTGYENVQIEPHIYFRGPASGSEHLVRSTTHDGHTVNFLNDDTAFMWRVDAAVNSGDPSEVIAYLDQLWEEDVDDEYVVAYYQDAEATGLWDYEAGFDPRPNWPNLGTLIAAIEADGRFRLVTSAEAHDLNPPAEDVSPIPDGAANWMNRDAWFGYNDDPVFDGYRDLFDRVRDTLNVVQAEITASAGDTTAAAALLRHAWFTFVAHQYEFAVWGALDGFLTGEWDMIRTALAPARAARHALNPAPGVYREDFNLDTVAEVVLVGEKDLVVLTPLGGRLLYWFDLERGVEQIGNENFYHYAESWVSDSWRLPLLQGGQDVYKWLAGNNIFPEVHTWTYEIRRRGLADSLAVAGAPAVDLGNTVYDVTLLEDGVRFTHDVGNLTMAKEVRIGPAGVIEVDYGFSGAGAPVRLTTESGLSPALLEVMDGGVGTLAWWDGVGTEDFRPQVTGVLNRRTGDRVEIVPQTTPDASSGREVVFGRVLAHEFSGQVPGAGALTFSLRLERTFDAATPVRVTRFEAAPGAAGVALSWRLEDAGELAGLHVWREGEGAPARLTGTPLAPAADGYRDLPPHPGRWTYRLQGLDRAGGVRWLAESTAEFAPALAAPALVLRASPNPFRGATTVALALGPDAVGQPYRLDLFDAAGRRLRTLAAGRWEGAAREIGWDGRDDAGRRVPPGVYFLRLHSNRVNRAQKLVRLP